MERPKVNGILRNLGKDSDGAYLLSSTRDESYTSLLGEDIAAKFIKEDLDVDRFCFRFQSHEMESQRSLLLRTMDHMMKYNEITFTYEDNDSYFTMKLRREMEKQHYFIISSLPESTQRIRDLLNQANIVIDSDHTHQGKTTLLVACREKSQLLEISLLESVTIVDDFAVELIDSLELED